MELFLDSSDIQAIKKWKGIVKGFTTNPSILLKDGTSIEELVKATAGYPLSIEASGDFITEAKKYYREIPNAVIKIPLLKPSKGDNLSIIRELSEAGIPVNCTALFSLPQVILASKAGATYVSLFAGRIDDEGGDSASVISECTDYLNGSAKLIVGSIRTVGTILSSISAGADIITVPPTILEKMLDHHYSRETVLQFEEDARKLKERGSGSRRNS